MDRGFGDSLWHAVRNRGVKKAFFHSDLLCGVLMRKGAKRVCGLLPPALPSLSARWPPSSVMSWRCLPAISPSHSLTPSLHGRAHASLQTALASCRLFWSEFLLCSDSVIMCECESACAWDPAVGVARPWGEETARIAAEADDTLRGYGENL